LDEACYLDQGGNRTIRRILDEVGLSHSQWQVSDRGSLHVPRVGCQHADHRDGSELTDYQPMRTAPRSKLAPL
jgi:hypothetical protein